MSKMWKSYLAVEGVVSAIQSYLDSFEHSNDYEVMVYPYQNGRENGFTFYFAKGRDGQYLYNFHQEEPCVYNAFYVAECRNSDQISIIPGVASDWHDGMSETDYHQGRRFVDWGDYMGAVKVIMELVGTQRVPQYVKVGV